MDETRDTELGRRLEASPSPTTRRSTGTGPPPGSRAAAVAASLAPRSRHDDCEPPSARAAARRAVAAAVAAVAAAAGASSVCRARPAPRPSRGQILKRVLTASSSGRTWQADVMLKVTDWDRWEGPTTTIPPLPPGAEHRRQLPRDPAGADPPRRVGRGDERRRPTSWSTTRRPACSAATARTRGRRERNYPLGPPDRRASPLTGVDFGGAGAPWRPPAPSPLEETVVDGGPAWTMTCTKG